MVHIGDCSVYIRVTIYILGLIGKNILMSDKRLYKFTLERVDQPFSLCKNLLQCLTSADLVDHVGNIILIKRHLAFFVKPYLKLIFLHL